MADKKTDIDMTKNWYYLELARLSTGLFIGIMALMTFLLTVGLQHPQKPFAAVFYTTVSLLAFGLITYVVGQMLQQLVINGNEANWAKMALRITRILQQAAFILSVLSVLALVLVSAHIFFAVPATPAAPAGGGQ